jgi:uncharacterized protein YndB with AHSA1/START domain
MSSTVTLRDEGPMIVATVLLPECTPHRALSAFTDPTLVSQWWRGELTTSLEPGSDYHVAFPAINATLHGQVVSHEPGQSLEFTWTWAGEDVAPSKVQIAVAGGDKPDSVVLTVIHGPHSDDEPGRRSHQEHWEGWEYFLPRLATAVSE